MKLKLLLFLIAGFGISEMVAGAAVDKNVQLALNKSYDKAHRSTTSPDFQAFLDASFLSVEQTCSSEAVTFTVTITNVSTGATFTILSHESTCRVDLNRISLGEYRIEIDAESVSLLGFFTL